MTADDVEAARVVQALAFAGPDDPTDPSTFPPEVTMRQHQRYELFLTHDAPGSWVAERSGGVVGIALALRRDDLWGLSLLAVRPDCQAKGIGQQLGEASPTYAADPARGRLPSAGGPRGE